MARSRRWRCRWRSPRPRSSPPPASRPRSSPAVGAGHSSLRTRIDLLDFAAVELRRPDPTADFDEVLALVQACDRAVYGDSDWTADELREEWDDLDLGSDAWIAVADGRIAGVDALPRAAGEAGCSWTDTSIPSSTGRGAGSLLLAAAELRALELAAEAPVGSSDLGRDRPSRRRPGGARAARGPRVHDVAHLPPDDHRSRRRDPGRGRGPTASSCGRSTPTATAGS